MTSICFVCHIINILQTCLIGKVLENLGLGLETSLISVYMQRCCVGICGRLMRCMVCRYMCGIYGMEAVQAV